MRDEALASYQFGPFRFVVRENGRLVTKDQIIEEVWPDSFVGDGSLSRNISVLRKVLGDGYIDTIPKSGYRFAGLVTRSIEFPMEHQSTGTDRFRTDRAVNL